MRFLFFLLAIPLFAQTKSVTVTWADTANPPATQYNVYRAPGVPAAGQVFAKVNATPVTPKTYTDSAVPAGQYTYYVTAFLAGLESTPSVSVGAPVPPAAPGQPTITVTVTVTVQ